jgi:DNA-directed RNA polymerase subunit E'/Rpb7
MSTTTFTKKIQIFPELLDNNIEKSINMVVKQKFEGLCTEKQGYIVKVISCKIRDISVSDATSLVDVSVAIEARCVKPLVNTVFTGRICLIFKLGVLLEVANVLKVLVPFCNGCFTIDGKDIPYTLCAETNTFHVSDPFSNYPSLTVGELRQLRVTGVQYNTVTATYNSYGCFCINK